MSLGFKVITPENTVRSVFELPDNVSANDCISVLEAEHPECEIIVGSVEPEAEPEHSFEVGDYAVDDIEPTPSPEVNTVEVVELIDERADEFVVKETGKTVAEHKHNRHYPSDDLVVAGIYPNMGGDQVWHFPESRLRQV